MNMNGIAQSFDKLTSKDTIDPAFMMRTQAA
jgi:hypothetical protein